MDKHIETAIRNRTMQQVLLRCYVGDAPAHITYGELGAIAVLLSRRYPAGPEDLPVDDGLMAATLLCS